MTEHSPLLGNVGAAAPCHTASASLLPSHLLDEINEDTSHRAISFSWQRPILSNPCFCEHSSKSSNKSPNPVKSFPKNCFWDAIKGTYQVPDVSFGLWRASTLDANFFFFFAASGLSWGTLLCHEGSFIALHRLKSCSVGLVAPWHVGS